MSTIIFSFLIAWAFTIIIMPLIIKINKRILAQQTILKYVEEHKNKQGTTTMGGVIFFITTLAVVFFFLDFRIEWFIILAVALGFALLGFLDDFIKVRWKQNLGLRPYQKIIGQVGISIILAFYVYYSTQGGTIVLPFTYKSFELGWWIIPIIVFVCIATTNSVNITDGLDGLASNVSLIFLAGIVALILILKNRLYVAGADTVTITNLQNNAVLTAVFCGSLFGYLIYNTNRASVFMGDVGSLGIGGFISALCCTIGFELFIPLLGIMFVVNALSDIIQVLYYKKTKKRIFKMAPLHHHFQQCGHSEAKIVFVYSTITVIMCLITVLLTII